MFKTSFSDRFVRVSNGLRIDNLTLSDHFVIGDLVEVKLKVINDMD